MPEIASLIDRLTRFGSTANSPAPSPGELLVDLHESVRADLESTSPAAVPLFRTVLTALATLPDNVEPERQVELILAISSYFYVVGQPFEVIESVDRAEALASTIGKPALLATVINRGGVLCSITGNISKAIEKHRIAGEMARACGDAVNDVTSWINIGAALMDVAENELAAACMLRAADLSEKNHMPWRRINALSNLSLIYWSTGEFAKGLRAAESALADKTEPPDAWRTHQRVALLRNAARLQLALGNIDGARPYTEAARRYASKMQSPKGEVAALLAEGLLMAYSGQADDGIERLVKALELARSIQLPLTDVLLVLIKAFEYLNQPERALIYLRELMDHNQQHQQENILRQLRLDLRHTRLDAIPESGRAATEFKKQELILKGKRAEIELAESRRVIKKSEQELFKSRIELLERLAVTAELRDDSTGLHSYRVGKLAALLAQEFGCGDDIVFMMDLAGRLHDIGKVGIPDAILMKPGKLTAGEREIMCAHAAAGGDLLTMSSIPHLQMAEDIARHHHEWWDGSGYPGGLAGTGIPVFARLTALADVYDALTHQRPYKQAWPIDDALAEILSLKGRQFDPNMTDLFLNLMARLRRTHADLDGYLGLAAAESLFLQARKKIWDTLRKDTPGTAVAAVAA